MSGVRARDAALGISAMSARCQPRRPQPTIRSGTRAAPAGAGGRSGKREERKWDRRA